MIEELKRRVLEHGIVVSDQVLKLDTILNHQVDPKFVMTAGQALAKRYADEGITKVLTIEASGISVAMGAALELDVPFVFARRKRTLTTDADAWVERVPSFTKGIVTDIVISREMLQPHDRILLIDDIIANGDAARGLIRIVERSGATLVGVGLVVEKLFQNGGSSMREQGIRVESLVKVKSLKDGKIELD